MIELRLPDISCGHCERAVKAAIASEDPQAVVQVHLAEHRVEIASSLPETRLRELLAAEGYPALA
jgi:copper chaperone